MASKAGHGTDIAFGQNTPQPLTDGTAFGWSDSGEAKDSSFGLADSDHTAPVAFHDGVNGSLQGNA